MTVTRRVLLLGASGRLGSAIATALRSQPGAAARPAAHCAPLECLAPPTALLRLDPRRPLEAAGRWLDAWKPDTVVNCIAMSDVDRCELEPAEARRINSDLPGALALAAERARTHLVHFSTDFVFDGEAQRPYREDDPANPLSIYGESKLAGENAIGKENTSYWIFRVSWLYGGPARNLAATLLDPANARRPLALADDRVGVPNPVQLLAREVAFAIGTREEAVPPASGVYHLSCRGCTTWYGFGRAFLDAATAAGRIAPSCAPRIEPIAEKALDRPARRPRWSVLDPLRYENAFGRALPDWREAIALALEPTE